MPVLEVRARRVGGSNYQVPVEVRPERRTTLGLRWLVNASRARGEHTMKDRLAKEIMDAANNTGASVRNVKILTKWLKQTVPLHTSAGNHKFQAELQSYIHKLRLWICNRLTLNSNNIIHII